METFRTIIVLASMKKLPIGQHDVKAIYLHGNLEKFVYLE